MADNTTGGERRRLSAHKVKASQAAAKGKPPKPDAPFEQPDMDPFAAPAMQLQALTGYQFPNRDESRWYVRRVMERCGCEKWQEFANLLGIPHLSTIARWLAKTNPSRPSNLYMWRMGVLQNALLDGYPVREIYKVNWDALPMSVIWDAHSAYAAKLAGNYRRGNPNAAPKDGFSFVARRRGGGYDSSAEFLVPDLAVAAAPCPECGDDVTGVAARGSYECGGCAVYCCSNICLSDHITDCADYAEYTAADDGSAKQMQPPAGKGEPQKPPAEWYKSRPQPEAPDNIGSYARQPLPPPPKAPRQDHADGGGLVLRPSGRKPYKPKRDRGR